MKNSSSVIARPDRAIQPTHTKVLFLALSGIGNLLMQMPTIVALKKEYPDWHITVWIAPRGTKALAANEPAIDEVLEMPIKNSLSGHLQTIKTLRQKQFDTGIVLHPGQQLKSAAILRAAGIPQRIGHQYPLRENPQSSFLLTDTIPIQPNLHDLEQNLNILKTLGIGHWDLDISAPYSLPIPESSQQQAEQILSQLNMQDSAPIYGLHPGSAPDFLWKRWPLANFAEVAKYFIAKQNAHILIFGGPDEEPQKQQLQQEILSRISSPFQGEVSAPSGAEGGVRGTTSPVSIITTDLLTTSAIIKECNLFISNDSGLMHLAAAAGVKTFGLFGPTDETKTGPRGQSAHTIRAPGTKPIYDTNQNYFLGTEAHPTLTSLAPSQVIDIITNVG